MKSRRPRDRRGPIYNRDKYKIWHYTKSVYTILVQNAGIVSVVISDHAQTVRGTITLNNGITYKYTATGIRTAILHGVAEVHRIARVLYDVNKFTAVLDTLCIYEEQPRYISTSTHYKLYHIIHDLINATRQSGMPGLHRKILELARGLDAKS